MFKFSQKSYNNMKGVHPELIFLAQMLIKKSKVDLIILNNGGVRTLKQQKQIVKNKHSKTLNSYHRYGLALDIVLFINNSPNWVEIEKYNIMIKQAYKIIKKYKLNIEHPLKWDLPHFQMKLKRTPSRLN